MAVQAAPQILDHEVAEALAQDQQQAVPIAQSITNPDQQATTLAKIT